MTTGKLVAHGKLKVHAAGKVEIDRLPCTRRDARWPMPTVKGFELRFAASISPIAL